jgi:hypothetical protein
MNFIYSSVSLSGVGLFEFFRVKVVRINHNNVQQFPGRCVDDAIRVHCSISKTKNVEHEANRLQHANAAYALLTRYSQTV